MFCACEVDYAYEIFLHLGLTFLDGVFVFSYDFPFRFLTFPFLEIFVYYSYDNTGRFSIGMYNVHGFDVVVVSSSSFTFDLE